MALRHGEYRESVDMDFLVSDATGYRELRQLLTGPTGIASITRPEGPTLSLLREIRADQYGIRTQVQMDGAAIKFEIVREARFTLQGSGPHDTLCGVSTLTALDLATAIDRLAQRSGWLERCMRAMGMTVPQAVVWQRVRALRRVLPSQR
jgi:hypothetical protein